MTTRVEDFDYFEIKQRVDGRVDEGELAVKLIACELAYVPRIVTDHAGRCQDVIGRHYTRRLSRDRPAQVNTHLLGHVTASV